MSQEMGSVKPRWARGSQGCIRSDGMRVMMSYHWDKVLNREIPEYWKIWGKDILIQRSCEIPLPEILAWVDETYPPLL